MKFAPDKEIDQATIDETAFAFRDIFNRDLIGTTDGNELYQLLLEEFKKEPQYLPLEDDYHGTYPFGNCFHETSKMLNRWANIRDPKSLFDSVRSEKGSKGLSRPGQRHERATFVGQHIKEYNAIGLFYKNHRENILELDIDVQEKADKIKSSSTQKTRAATTPHPKGLRRSQNRPHGL
ncbi:MAG: hypothetical protein R2791_12410 [Saprospiraceae bacterium]